MYHVSIKLYKHERKFGRTRNAVGIRATGECFHSFFEFSQTFMSVCITLQKHRVHVFYFFQKTPRGEKGKQLVNFDYQSVNYLCSHHHYVNSMHLSSVSPSSYTNTILNQSARVLSWDCFLINYMQLLTKIYCLLHWFILSNVQL